MAREILWLTFGFCGTPDVQSFRETICSLIRYHSLPLHILEQVEPERCAIKTASVGKLARDFSLWILALADMRGRICGDREEALERLCPACRERAEEELCPVCGAPREGWSVNAGFDWARYQELKGGGDAG